MYRFYQIIFLVGVLYTAATFFLGNLLDSFDWNVDFDIDLEGDISASTISPLKPIIIVSFMTTFGGMGMLGYQWEWLPVKTFAVALLTGVSIASILYRGIIVPLYKAEAKSMAVKKENLIGKKAEVMNAILENGCGKISYIANQNKYTGTAKSIDGSRIEQNKQVVILDIEENVFYVKTVVNLEKKPIKKGEI